MNIKYDDIFGHEDRDEIKEGLAEVQHYGCLMQAVDFICQNLGSERYEQEIVQEFDKLGYKVERKLL